MKGGGAKHQNLSQNAKTEDKMKKFEINKTYYARSIADHECIFSMTVLNRTDKTLKVVDEYGHHFNPRIKSDDVAEYVILERYSMAPIYRATREC